MHLHVLLLLRRQYYASTGTFEWIHHFCILRALRRRTSTRVHGVQVLLNNAGVLIYTDFDSVTAEDLLHCFTVNAVGPLLVSQQLHRRGLIGGRGGPTLIGNVTSKVRHLDGTDGGILLPPEKRAGSGAAMLAGVVTVRRADGNFHQRW
jgi:NAD(P)-dependent dehydrogenase (short-subunit alcohol dehydrogenase family)